MFIKRVRDLKILFCTFNCVILFYDQELQWGWMYVGTTII